MNFPTILLVVSVLFTLVSAILSYTMRENVKMQFWALLMMVFSVGLLAALLSSFDNKSFMIWPALLLFRIFTLTADIIKFLPKS
jgi:intracellular septation protein A